MLDILYTFIEPLAKTVTHLSQQLKKRMSGLFSLMFLQSILELAFIYTLSNMALALTNGDALRDSFIYRHLFSVFPALHTATTDPRYLLLLAGSFVILVSAIKNFTNFYTARTTSLLGEDISLHVGQTILHNYLYKDYAWHLSSASGSMFQCMLWRHQLSQMLIELLSFYSFVLTILVLFFSLVAQEPLLTSMVIFITLGVGILLFKAIRRKIDHSAKTMTSCNRAETNVLMCVTKGVREVLIYNQQQPFSQAFMQAVIQGRKAKMFTQIAPTLPTWILEAVGFILVIFAIAFLIFVQDADVPRISAALSLLILTAWRVLPYCNRIIGLHISIRGLKPMANAVLDLLESLQGQKESAVIADASFSFKNTICLKNLEFSYANSAVKNLESIELSIKKGEKIGLIGTSGAGKSTLAGVLSGLLLPTGGEMLVDDAPLTPARAKAFSRMIGYVPQTPFLFAGTLAENIAFSEWGKPWDEERLRHACTQAAIDFVDAHPQGLEQPIGENGAGLSGGQAQRVSIARAMYTTPKVLIFDEATSALDQQNENAIQETIDNLADSVTCIIIAHRLTTVEKCDRLVWMEKGRIVMQGDTASVLQAYRKKSALVH